MQRVVITGQGAVSALGMSADATMAGMRDGQLGIGPLEFRDADRLTIRIGGQIKNYVPADNFTRQELTLYDPYTQFALLAAREAMAQSGLEISEHSALRAGVVLGTAGGGLQTQDDNYKAVYEDGKNRVHPFVVPRLMNNSAASHVSMVYFSWCLSPAPPGSKRAEKGAIKKLLNNYKFLLPIHDRPAMIENQRVVGRLGMTVPGPMTETLPARNWFPV